ncbi:hypothetical protein B4140_0203 [Bacillus amyloliquefaciens]|nr:hypothetical protein B4140_0203 [Bacillus amyloliquefaciens]
MGPVIPVTPGSPPVCANETSSIKTVPEETLLNTMTAEAAPEGTLLVL